MRSAKIDIIMEFACEEVMIIGEEMRNGGGNRIIRGRIALIW